MRSFVPRSAKAAAYAAILLIGSVPSLSSAVTVLVSLFRGAWVSTATYYPGTVVTANGASYICLVRNTGVAPNTNTGDWSILDAPGATGPQGPAGARGPQGPAGAAGAQGAAGTPGPQGPAGPVGATGPAGPPGAAGATGTQGPAGAMGPAGAQGPAGPQGSAGAPGSPGSAGPPGPNGVFNYKAAWTSAAAYSANDVVTENGTSYVALQANSAVDPAADVNNSGGNWAILALAGAQGQQGLQGPAGPSGTNGLFGGPPPYGTIVGQSSDSSCVLGELKLLAGVAYPTNWAPADGRLLPIVGNQALFSLMGTIYGGDGMTNFAMPNLRSVAPNQSTGYFICTTGTFP